MTFGGASRSCFEVDKNHTVEPLLEPDENGRSCFTGTKIKSGPTLVESSGADGGIEDGAADEAEYVAVGSDRVEGGVMVTTEEDPGGGTESGVETGAETGCGPRPSSISATLEASLSTKRSVVSLDRTSVILCLEGRS